MGFNIMETIPYVAGGFMINSAFALNHRYGQRFTEASDSLYSMITLDSTSKWKSSFIAGMLFAASIVASIYGFGEIENTHVKAFETEKLFFTGTGLIQFMISGFLIGLGTRLARGGLTQYNAFYGLPKINRESIIFSVTVFIFGAITATLRSNYPILQGINITKKFSEHLDFRLSFAIPLIMLFFNLARHCKSPMTVKEILISFGIGNILAVGMMAAGLARRHQVIDFLSLNAKWNPFLIFVVIGAMLSNMFFFQLFPIRRVSASIGERLSVAISPKMLLGCALFGTGLGISGLTPGAGLLVSPVYLPHIVLFFLPFIVVGQMVGRLFDIRGTRKVVKVL